MSDVIKSYLAKIDREFKTGRTTEHTHRPAFKDLIESLDSGVSATNEPKRVECGAPDFILRRDGRIMAYVDSTVFGQKVMIHPTHEPCIPDFVQLLAALFRVHFPVTPDRFIMQRGDQVTLQEALADCARLALPRFERMVKYLTVPLKVPVGAGAALKNRHHADPVTPMLKSSKR